MTSSILYIWSKHLVISASAGHVCGRVPYPAVAVDNDNIWSICGRPFSTASPPLHVYLPIANGAIYATENLILESKRFPTAL